MPRGLSISPGDEDFERVRTMLVDCPDGLTADQIGQQLRMNLYRVKDRLAHGRKEGLFLLSHAAGSPTWHAACHERLMRAKQDAARVRELARRRARARAWVGRQMTDDNVDPLPVRRVVSQSWEPLREAPGVTSVFAIAKMMG